MTGSVSHSSCLSVWARGLEISNHLFDPFVWIIRNTHCGQQMYRKYPIASRCVTVPINVVLAVAKVLALPAALVVGAHFFTHMQTVCVAACSYTTAGIVGIVALPIFAAIKWYHGKKLEAKQCLAAWTFCMLALAGTAAFIYVSSFHMNLLQGAVLFAAGLSVSIVVHVYRAVRTPPAVLLPQN